MRGLGVIFGAATMIVSTQAQSEASAGSFLREIGDGNEMTKQVLNAYENGFGWENAYLEQHGQRPVYCIPGKLALTPDQVADILRRYVNANPKMGGAPAGAALLYALQDTFPCRSAH